MCGRYQFSLSGEDPASRRLMALYARAYPDTALPEGEIFPGYTVPILVDGGEKLTLRRAKWGFGGTDSRPLINARWETAGEKQAFRALMAGGRCVVPVSGFYEWSGQREKYLFRGDAPLLYLAGLCRPAAEGLELVILTRSAGRWVRGVHHRMPVILPQQALLDWVHGAPQAVFEGLPEAHLTGICVAAQQI